MLFGTYGAPPAPRGKNPLIIILGVCGGCALLVAIAIGVVGYMGYNMTKNLIGGAVKMPQTEMTFVRAIKSHDYASAASVVDPSAQSTLSATKIKSIVEQAEHKLGPIQQTSYRPGQPLQSTLPGPTGRPQFIEYSYHVPLKFKKGSSTAILKFRSADMGSGQDVSKLKLSGLITGFSLQSENE